MRITIEEVAALIAASSSMAAYDTKEIAALRERVLKLEHKTNELLDLLTDVRVNQIMDPKEAPGIIADTGIRINIIKSDVTKD